MKGIIFTIKTSYSEEEYFLMADTKKSIENQIHDALASISYCDSYEIITWKAVTDEYVNKRNEMIAEYEKSYGLLEEEFCSGRYVVLEAILEDIKWRKENPKRTAEKAIPAPTPAATQPQTDRNIASEIVELFEDLLDEKEIDIPCADTEEEKIRVEESGARLYGMEYWHLIEAVENLLSNLPCRVDTTMGGADATLQYEEGKLIVESEQLNDYLEEYSME